MKPHLACLALAGSLLAAAGVARAADGRIEINQTRALQTGCSPLDTPGFPVSLSSGTSYVLTSSLSVSSEGVAALSSGGGTEISIDLNGFEISGAYACNVFPPDCVPSAQANGIDAPTATRVVVRNGNVTRFTGGGIVVGGFARVEDVGVDYMGGVGILVRSGSLVLDNRVSNVRDDAIRVAFNESTLSDGRVEGNAIRSGRADGIVTGNALVLGNYVTGFTSADGAFGTGAAWGHNRFDGTPTGGRSLGDNVCGTTLC